MGGRVFASDADLCRSRGWGVGTILAGSEDKRLTLICITAVGNESILATRLYGVDGEKRADRENTWTLRHRDWWRVA